MAPKATENLLSEVTTGKIVKKELKNDLEERVFTFPEEDTVPTTTDWRKILYGAGDVLFASIVVTPLVVGIWRGVWGLMDLHRYLFPYAQTYLLGIVIHVSFALVRSTLLSRSQGAWSDVDGGGGAGRWLRERVISRVYTCIFIMACIMHWRGGWGIFDATVVAILPDDDDPHRPVLIAAFLALVYLFLAWLRSSRNLLASPFFLVTDGKEPTYIFSTRFRKTRAGEAQARRIQPPHFDMRGSTAGLADTLAGGSRAHAALLELADALFASVVVAPAVVTYWKSTWSLLDLYVLTEDQVASAAACAALGLLYELVTCVFQTGISSRLSPDRGRLTYYVCSRLYTWLAGLACVGAWRGVWNLLNECTGDSARTLMSTTAAATLSLAALRALRNICAAPFAVAVDTPQDYFDVPTMFRTSSRETALYILDCIFSVAVVGSLVVFVWRGSWALLDIYLYPDDPARSCWTSLIGGYIIVALTFGLQAPVRWSTARLHGAPRLLLADVYHLMSFFATVNVWRGVWGLMDLFLFPETPKLSNWCSHVVSLGLLMLLNCSNSVLVRGVYIDAEEPAGECVVFPCHYLRLFFHKERTKKRHRRALAAAAAATTARHSQDASLTPLQIPTIEEKV